MPKRKSVFSDELRKKYPCFKKGRSDFEAECITCGYGTFISVANKGSISLEDHIKTTKHKQGEVAGAEATMAFHTVKHHYSYKSNDCTSTLMAKIFPDSSTAKKFSCARTKIEAIVNNVLAPASVQCVLNDIEKHEIMYLGVSTDLSNHKSTKLFPIAIQYFDWKNGGMQSKLLDVRSLKDETSLTIVIIYCK